MGLFSKWGSAARQRREAQFRQQLRELKRKAFRRESDRIFEAEGIPVGQLVDVIVPKKIKPFGPQARGRARHITDVPETDLEILEPHLEHLIRQILPKAPAASPEPVPELIRGYPSVRSDMYDTGWITVSSSNVRAIRWTSETDANNFDLYGRDQGHVQFHTGSQYVYFNMAREMFVGLLRAGSQGKYIRTVIAPNFEYREMTSMHKCRIFPHNYAGPHVACPPDTVEWWHNLDED